VEEDSAVGVSNGGLWEKVKVAMSLAMENDGSWTVLTMK
jgi:hypothetical protein